MDITQGVPYLVTGTRGVTDFVINGCGILTQGVPYLVTGTWGVAHFVMNGCIEF